jgi:hypothetical protein
MGEGFGDCDAASFFAETEPLPMRPTLGNWDATSYSGVDDGEIWSACLWEIRTALGRKITDVLVIAHHFLLSRTATFQNAANALITADQNLNGSRNKDIIRDLFVRRGILPNQNRKNKREGLPFNQLE